MKKICITGGNGFLGNNLSSYLYSLGYNVLILDDLSESYEENLPPNIRFKNVDISNFAEVSEVFSNERPDVVFQLAANANECLSHWVRNDCITRNILANTNIISACVENDVSKLIFTSSIAKFGAGTPPFKETDPANPTDVYGLSKLFCEEDIKLANRTFGLKYNILIPFNITGDKYQNLFSLYRNVIGIWCRQTIWEKKPITVYGDGSCVRAFSNVKYMLPCMEKLIHGFDNETFNIGAETFFRVIDAAQIFKSVAKKFGHDVEIVHLEPRDEVGVAYCDVTKAKQTLGYEDKTNLEETITEMFEWALTQTYKIPRKFQYEITKNLYSFWR